MLKAMKVTYREIAFLAGAIFLVWILVQAGEILVPFILAGIFSFALNPVVSFLSKYVRLPRTVSILLVYSALTAVIVWFLVLVTSRLISEIRLITVGSSIDATAQKIVNDLPTWDIAGQQVSLQILANQSLANLLVFTSNLESRALGIFQGVLREGVYFLVFLVSAFYLLKDGKKFKSGIESMIPEQYRGDFLVVWSKVQVVLGNYLRGQLLLMLIIGLLSYLLFETLGIRYSLILAIIAGLLEVVPIIGPIGTAIIAAAVAFFTGDNRYGLDPTTLTLAVVAGSFVIQQLENYVIVPNLYARLTALHPILVLFVVIIGGAVFGPIGFILAVPTTASIKAIAEYFASKS